MGENGFGQNVVLNAVELKAGPFFVFWGFLFLKISFSLQKERIFQNKQKTTKKHIFIS